MKKDIKEQFTPNELTKNQKSNILVRTITSVIAIAIILPCIFFGGWVFAALILIVVILAGYEIVHCAKKHYNPLLYIVTILLIGVITFYPLIRSTAMGETSPNWQLYNAFSTLHVSVAVIIIGAILLFFLVTIDKNFEVRDAAYIFTFGIIVGVGLQCILTMRFLPQYEYYKSGATQDNTFNFLTSTLLTFYLLLGCFMTDIGAYFTGLFFGRKKINERISPKKTWEGAIGGTIISIIFSFFFAFIFASYNIPLLSIFTADRWYNIFIISLILPIISQLGDFIFSSVKRYYGIKDFGFIMPGHGGVLDRIDSVIFGFSLAAMIILIMLYSQTNSSEWWKAII